MANSENHSLKGLLNPVVLVAFLIVGSVILLIAAAAVGLDKGVLLNMARSDFARGLITYLFALVTIGTAVVLVLSALQGGEGEAHDKRFQHGKEILSLLLGVFGTIIGFYFGSETAAGARGESAVLRVSTADISPMPVAAGGTFTVRAVSSGGVLPHRFGVSLGSDAAEAREPVNEGGWIKKEMTGRAFRPDEPHVLHLVVQDASGRSIEQTMPLEIKPGG